MIDLSLLYSCLEYADDRRVIGVKIIKEEKEYLEHPFLIPTHQMFFCMYVKAAVKGHAFKVDKEHLYCSMARRVLGFSESEEELTSGRQAFERKMYCSLEISKDAQGQFPYAADKIAAFCIAPLEKFDSAPDIVISISNPYTAMRLLQTYAYHYSYPQNLLVGGMSGFCAELAAHPLRTQDINLSLLCSNARFSGEWRDEEMGVAMPYFMFEKILSSIEQSMNLFEPNRKKREIERRSQERGLQNIDIRFDSDYYGSCLGAAKLGVCEYRKKKDDF